jgi:hypothetical protein
MRSIFFWLVVLVTCVIVLRVLLVTLALARDLCGILFRKYYGSAPPRLVMGVHDAPAEDARPTRWVTLLRWDPNGGEPWVGDLNRLKKQHGVGSALTLVSTWCASTSLQATSWHHRTPHRSQ